MLGLMFSLLIFLLIVSANIDRQGGNICEENGLRNDAIVMRMTGVPMDVLDHI